MPSWIINLRDVVWAAVLSALLVTATIVVAIVAPEAVGLILGLGISSITLALLSQRV